jgi:hypothetical protein
LRSFVYRRPDEFPGSVCDLGDYAEHGALTNDTTTLGVIMNNLLLQIIVHAVVWGASYVMLSRRAAQQNARQGELLRYYEERYGLIPASIEFGRSIRR